MLSFVHWFIQSRYVLLASKFNDLRLCPVSSCMKRLHKITEKQMRKKNRKTEQKLARLLWYLWLDWCRPFSNMQLRRKKAGLCMRLLQGARCSCKPTGVRRVGRVSHQSPPSTRFQPPGVKSDTSISSLPIQACLSPQVTTTSQHRGAWNLVRIATMAARAG